MATSTSNDVDVLLAKYPTTVQEIAAETRDVVREVLPEAMESIDRSANLIAKAVVARKKQPH